MKTKLKNLGKRVLPLWLVRRANLLRLWKAYLYDTRRFGRYCRVMGYGERVEQLKAVLMMTVHSIERGLSLKVTRPLFGEEKLKSIAEMLERWQKLGISTTATEFRMAIGSLNEYVVWHAAKNIDALQRYPFLKKWVQRDCSSQGGTLEVSMAQILSDAKGDLAKAICSRHSVRAFVAGSVPNERVFSAIRLAQRAPSVCNRQGARVRIIADPDGVRRALEIQGGAGGFLDDVAKVLVVTASLDVFSGNNERNQPYVDGGLFAMLLLLGLHYEGLGACPLNWCASPEKDRRLRRDFDIPDNESVIMLIAVGLMPEILRVAVSPRKPLGEIASVIHQKKPNVHD